MVKTKKNDDDEEPNHLINEKSPYLLQHTYNPVDWYPWGEEAFNKAKNEDKPIFLSIGYSTCHWCHVMAHESFEDPQIAEILNENFISIKVDREERPDIDKIYMNVCQIMTGSGGWPLTIIMTPDDKKPFFAGTYFPKETKYGRTGLRDLLLRIKELWKNKREKALESAEKVVQVMKRDSFPTKDKKLGEDQIHMAFDNLSGTFDSNKGGFGRAPKFPTPHMLRFLLRYWYRYDDDFSLYMVEKTLQNMRMGGIYDHVGFGFHRYSTDADWLVPHFEKMLYDQALIAMTYTEAYQITQREEYEDIVREIFSYIFRDMTSPEGGFFSAEDADVEGEEGKFYLWTESEIRESLNKDDAKFAIKIFNIEKKGNYFDQVERGRTGKNILYLEKTIKKLATDFGMSYKEFKSKLERIRTQLFNYRESRTHPLKDDKILTDWNGLMISALAQAAKVLNEPIFAKKAATTVDFIFNNLFSNNTLFHRYRNGNIDVVGNLNDYCFLIWGLIELYEATFDFEYLKKAIKLNEIILEQFYDQEIGGFYFTSTKSEDLLIRQKEIYDGATPSGNSVAMLNLLRLGRITNNSKLEEIAIEISEVFSTRVKKSPTAFTQLLIGVDFGIGPIKEIVIAGDKNSTDTQEMINVVQSRFLPHKVIILNPTNQESPMIHDLVEFIKNQNTIDNKATAYVCTNFSCQEPVNEIKKLEAMLDSQQ
ncbi:MAG: DUF255 domain-containing protein [Candidatus Lokiarchaeota archaeon]|nr:DUF255 domain-containing protein [Candidatus Lokiarchaeota archaeon]